MRALPAGWAKSLVTLALVLCLAACDRAKVYPVTPDTARAQLIGTTIPDIAFGASAHSGPGQAMEDGVAWPVERNSADGSSSDVTIMLLRARLASSGDATRVTVDIAPPPGVDPAKLQGVFDQHPAMARMFKSVAGEQVDSVLNGRRFSYANVSGDMALATLSELPDIRRRLDDEAKASDARDRDTIHRAYDQAK